MGYAILHLTIVTGLRYTNVNVMAKNRVRRDSDRALYYRTTEVASVLGISLRTLLRKLKSGEFPEPKRDQTNNYRIWTISDIEQLRALTKG